MNLIVDANVLFSALIKDSFSSNILLSGKFQLFTPEYIFIEMEKHKEEILNKTERTTEDFFRFIDIFKRKIIIVPLEELSSYCQEAEIFTPDPNDMVYFALALKLNCSIWSNDKKLKEQNKVKVYNTTELSNL